MINHSPYVSMSIMMVRHPVVEFHISRKARDLYRFDESLYSLSGNVVFTNFHSVRIFAQKMNDKKDLANFPEQTVRPGELNAMALIDEILHHIVGLYREQINKDAIGQALTELNNIIGIEKVDNTLLHFLDEFPPLKVYRGESTVEEYMNGKTSGIDNRQILLEEMLLLWLANMNPAFTPFHELFDDTDLKKHTAYLSIIEGLWKFFDNNPPFGPYNQNLIEMLRAPAIEVPHSLSGQLEYIRKHWGYLLSKYFHRLLKGIDVFKEEQKIPFTGHGIAEVLQYTGLEVEGEYFSPDLEWMPRLVLIAKNIYVWLDQLSKKYQRPITKLHDIPDEELAILQIQGFTGLWLIGIWERSPSSQKIKQLCGNPEAVASAYSLFDYTIAVDLGGEKSYKNLKERAWRYGIRLASDMVPNHMGIYSRWVIEHPDWFISLPYNPFPWYSFNGPDLSSDERVSIYIEDHYYNRTDAAVVFKRLDRWTGNEQYIYHGNDGTSMPWNDTAQLNYLKPEVREAMIQTILHVARKFPIIRFDAAMTLTNRHFHRLWFPQPGSGGAIPTRSEFGLSNDEFNKLMPNEFWREVVDRVAAEAPDTLLLAEAFWLLEGYFVRTLGMHRVYNSAFMNMLRDEDNAKYRAVIKNTLEFDPEILRRFVNFMNNPDERTAVDQFGKGDKYFGICTMMVTMPGLPMFGHGQIEGFAEKYGMEYRRAYWEEEPDNHLVERHHREIFPLLHKRYLFAGVEHFLLYDFFTGEGVVNENVFAYSNGYGNERILVAYHNKNSTTSGWIKVSAAYSDKRSQKDKHPLIQKNLVEGLSLNTHEKYFVIFRDQATNLEYIRNNRELEDKGLYLELGPYRCHVFYFIRQIHDNEWGHYSLLNEYLNGRGVSSIEEALREMLMQPVYDTFRKLVNADMFRNISDTWKVAGEKKIEVLTDKLLDDIEQIIRELLNEIKRYKGATVKIEDILKEIRLAHEAIIRLLSFSLEEDAPWKMVIEDLKRYLKEDNTRLYVLFGWLSMHVPGKVLGNGEGFSFYRIFAQTLRESGCDEKILQVIINIVKIIMRHQSWFTTNNTIKSFIESLLQDREVKDFLQINRYKNILWFSKERFEQLMQWLKLIACIKIISDLSKSKTDISEAISSCHDTIEKAIVASRQSGYQVEKLIKITGAHI